MFSCADRGLIPKKNGSRQEKNASNEEEKKEANVEEVKAVTQQEVHGHLRGAPAPVSSVAVHVDPVDEIVA